MTAVEIEAADLTAKAIEEASPRLARRALALREEVQLQRAVRAWKAPEIDGDAGPSQAFARGPVERTEVGTMTDCPRKNDFVPTVDVATRRALSRTLTSLSADQQRAARAYEALVAQRGALRCIDPSMAAGPGGVSDGGAAARWDADALLRSLELAIGDGIALPVTRRTRHPDRSSRAAITVRCLVDEICISGKTIDEVLRRKGWSRDQRHRQILKQALADALDRIAALT